MKTIGIIMWVSGAALACYAALAFDTSVGGFGGQRIVNMGLQQQQLMMLIVGGILFVVGVLLHVASMFVANPVTDVGTDSATTGTPQRLAYARSLGVRQTPNGYEYAGSLFDKLEDAILAAQPA